MMRRLAQYLNTTKQSGIRSFVAVAQTLSHSEIPSTSTGKIQAKISSMNGFRVSHTLENDWVRSFESDLEEGAQLMSDDSPLIKIEDSESAHESKKQPSTELEDTPPSQDFSTCFDNGFDI